MRNVWPRVVELVTFVVVLCVLTALAGCGSTAAINNAALLIASCPEMGEADIVTPADSYRLHVADAKLYNTCRCAALKDFPKHACPEPVKPTP
jgi:hypothetical protein